MSTNSPTTTLVIPTIGRPSLLKTLASVRLQAGGRGPDEVLLIGDGPCPGARCLWEQFGLAGRYVELPERLGKWGHGVRNWVNENRLATCDYLMNLDDDDRLAADALVKVRRALVVAPHRPHIFRMAHRKGVSWVAPGFKRGNVGTPMLVCPNVPGKLGTWQMRYGGDHEFIVETCSFYPDGPVWRPEVICVVGEAANG